MKTEIDQQKWCCGRFGMKTDTPRPMLECYWNVSVDMIVSTDGWNEIGYYYKWDAFTNDACRVKFDQSMTKNEQSTTYEKSLKSWFRFAKLHGIKHHGIIPQDAESLFSFAKVDEKLDELVHSYYSNRILGMHNELSRLGCRAIYEMGIFGGAELQGKEKAARLKEMEASGEAKRLNDLEKAVETADFSFLRNYHNYDFVDSTDEYDGVDREGIRIFLKKAKSIGLDRSYLFHRAPSGFSNKPDGRLVGMKKDGSLLVKFKTGITSFPPESEEYKNVMRLIKCYPEPGDP